MTAYIITEKLANDIRTAIRLGCDGTLPNENELMDAIYSCPYNPQDSWTTDEIIEHEKLAADAERELIDELILEINRVSLTGFTKYTYRRWILKKLREGKDGE